MFSHAVVLYPRLACDQDQNSLKHFLSKCWHASNACLLVSWCFQPCRTIYTTRKRLIFIHPGCHSFKGANRITYRWQFLYCQLSGICHVILNNIFRDICTGHLWANVASIKMTELRWKRSSMSTPRKLHRTFYRHQIFVKAFLSGMWVAPSPFFVGVVVDFTAAPKNAQKYMDFFFEFSNSMLRVWTVRCVCVGGGGHPGEKRPFPSPMSIVGMLKRLMFMASYRFVFHYIWMVYCALHP